MREKDVLLSCALTADESAGVKTMRHKRPLQIASFLFAIALVAALAWLTMPADEDPCANPQGDIGAAVLAEEAGDQEALVNRAIILRANCDEKKPSDQ